MNLPSPTDLLRERYGSSTFKPEHLWNETLASLLSHRSVRAYRPDTLPPQTLETLVAAAQSAATSSNLQTWSVVAVEDPLRKDTLAQLAGNQAHIRQCPLFLVWLADLARLHWLASQQGLSADGLDYLEMFVTATVDAALAAQNATITAESLGLGTVLARADVGIAMGGLGSDAAIETADVVLMTDAPSKVAEAMQVARKTHAIVWQNIIFALVVKGIFIALGVFGLATMWEAVFADVGVALAAILTRREY